MQKLVKDADLAQCIEIDSAGVSGAHAGERPDKRSQEAAKKRGYELSKLRARKVVATDFAEFQYLVAMDTGHLQYLQKMAQEIPETASAVNICLLLPHAPALGKTDVADPYYGPLNGFERVLDDIEQGCQALLNHLIVTHQLK